MVLAGVPTSALVVFALIGVALALFVSEVIPNDVTAIGIVVALAALEPWTGVDARGAISGFANTATVTIVAMYMLSAGIQRTGLVQRLGVHLARFTRGSETRALAAAIGTTGPIAGVVNNTPVVAVFIPMITDLARETGVSPSKLLLPLSYAAILGGTLTLIGTSTNLLASEFAAALLDRGPIGMFEFTALGAVVLVVGLAYLMTVGRWLTPARIPVDADLVEEFELEDFLAELRVGPDSAAVGLPIAAMDERTDGAVTPLQVRRNGETFLAAGSDQRIQPGDVVVLNGSRPAVNRFRRRFGLDRLDRGAVTEETFADADSSDRLGKAVVPETSRFLGETLSESRLEAFHGMTVLAIRRGSELVRTDLEEVPLEAGDLLLVQTTPESVEYFADGDDLLVIGEDALDRLDEEDAEDIAPLSPETPVAVAVMVAVVGLAALDVLPVVIAALGGVFAMVVTGCLSSADAYDAVSWNVVFLLAGVIPLGLAMEATGGAALIAEGLVATGSVLPLVAVLLLFYVVTGLLANVITPVATVVLMIPIAVDAAARLDASGFTFLLAVTFASATSFMTPVGYQTNLMVYGPGGYEFTDFLRVGGPLQLLLSVVTTLGIVEIWGI
ncbi:TrkA-C domain-containing protein [Halorubrum aquaticum]|uniref:TrkA-C domain-containing protein n=1 Tax=Halorubrum aquaticum TaxID=387340 RepID=A0A1I2ZEE2_9EURY|nr:SLC13 family permease [Halorubrum aquaticum]SFH36223.1 TrkA-C domain-containing protein [Halorubrum aquaticum]